MYFVRHFPGMDAEDLAQETMLAVLGREDYEFEREEDFIKVCYAFAKRTAMSRHRREMSRAASSLDELQLPPADSGKDLDGQVLLREVVEIAQRCLDPKEWEAIRRASEPDRDNLHSALGFLNANQFRVFLHRARAKLAGITGYRKR